MSTPNINALLSAFISAYDNQLPNTPLLCQVDARNPTLGAASYFYDQYFTVPTVATGITLPANPSFVAWIRNRSNSGGTILVNPIFLTTGSGVSQCTLGPGDLFLYFNQSKSATSGISSLSLTAVGSTCPCEIFLAA